jgi:type I restriction enzyme S subunit
MIEQMEFYEETDFKHTAIGKVPKDWKVSKMGDISQVKGRIGWRGLKASEYTPEGPYLIANKHLTNNRIIWDKCDHLSDFRYNESPEIQLQINDVIISKDGTIGQPAFIDSLPNKATLNSTMMLLRVNNVVLAPKFLFYFLQGSHFKRFLKQKISGTSIPHLFQRDMKELEILLPSLNEQKGIFRVLSVVDLAIELADKVIAKTERLKKGLMQQLLTRGIGHKEYKNTPIGPIPKTWQVEKLENMAKIRSNKSITKFEQIAFIPMELVPDSRIYAKYEIRRKEDVKSFTYCEAGDLLLAKITPSLENGKQGIVPCDIPNGIALATTEVFPIRCEGIYTLFLFYVLKEATFRNKIISSMIGSTGRQRASKESVERLEIPIPPIDEQRRIVSIFSAIDKKLELERGEKIQLEKIKLGLIDLLLTGKVRIKVD